MRPNNVNKWNGQSPTKKSATRAAAEAAEGTIVMRVPWQIKIFWKGATVSEPQSARQTFAGWLHGIVAPVTRLSG
jgi:hypothetical protein